LDPAAPEKPGWQSKPFRDQPLCLPVARSTSHSQTPLLEQAERWAMPSQPRYRSTLGMPPEPKPNWSQIIEALHGRETLMVLDAFERVLEERQHLSQLLEALPKLVILVTSRERLGLSGEWVFGLGGLDTPPPSMTRHLEAYSSAALFEQCARQVNQGFEINDGNRAEVGEICRLVGGLPLAIYLAAAWTRSLTCQEIAAEIRHSLDFLSAGEDEQHPRRF
jgi:predicted ATPase